MKRMKRVGIAMAIALALPALVGAAHGAGPPSKTGKVSKSSKLGQPIKPSPQTVSALFLACDDLRWGYIDKTGKVALSGYEEVGDFSDGLAVVRMGGRYGFVDAAGKAVITPRYDGAGKFSEGLAPALVGKLWGFVDKTGKPVIKPQFGGAAEFSEGLAVVGVDGKFGAINKNGDIVIQPSYQQMAAVSESLIAVNQDGKWGFVDTKGTSVIQPQFARVGSFSNGLAPAWSSGKWGFIDKSGRWVVQPKYDDAMPFSEGLAAVGVQKKEMVTDDKGRVTSIKTYLLWGYIDNAGKEVIALELANSGRFSEGLASTWKSGQFGFIDKTGAMKLAAFFSRNTGSFHNGLAKTEIGTRYGYVNNIGKMVIPQQFTSADPFSEGLAAVQVHERGLLGYVDTAGRMKINPQFQTAFGFRKGSAGVRMDWKWGIIDKTGKVALKPQFDAVSWYTDKIVAAKMKDLWGFYDWSGRAVLEPQFQSVSSLGENRAIVRKGSSYGVVDAAGVVVVPTQYDDCGWLFSEGLLPVSKGGKFGFIDAGGKSVIEPQYDAVGGFTPGSVCAVKVGQKWGFIDRNNKPLISPQYDAAFCFSEDRAAVKVGGLWGFIDKTGKPVVKPQFTQTGYFSRGMAPVQVGGKWGYVDKTGKLLIPARFDKAQNFDGELAQVKIGKQTGYINTTGKTVWMSKLYPSAVDKAPAPTQAAVTIGGDGVRTLKVKLAADQVFQKRADWSKVLEKRIQAASDVLEKDFKIRLALTAAVPWQSPDFKEGDDPDDYGTSVEGAHTYDVPRDDAEIVIGITGRDSGSKMLGFTHCYYNRVILYDPYNGAEDREAQLEGTLVHEICHTFGAFHVADEDSIMHATVVKGHVQTSFDQYTVRQMNLMRDYDLTKDVYSLSEDKVKQAAAIFAEGRIPLDTFPVASGHVCLGNALRWKHDIPGVIREYRRAVELEGREPDFGHVCLFGEALIEDGQIMPGIETLRKCPALQTDVERSAFWHGVLARDFERQLDSDNAFTSCQQAVKPTLAEIYQRYVLARVNPDEVFSQYREAIKDEPKDASYHFRFGEALPAWGRTDEALAEYRQAVALEPDNKSYKSKLEALEAQIAAQGQSSQ